jgi:hypothetical protein
MLFVRAAHLNRPGGSIAGLKARAVIGHEWE